MIFLSYFELLLRINWRKMRRRPSAAQTIWRRRKPAATMFFLFLCSKFWGLIQNDWEKAVDLYCLTKMDNIWNAWNWAKLYANWVHWGFATPHLIEHVERIRFNAVSRRENVTIPLSEALKCTVCTFMERRVKITGLRRIEISLILLHFGLPLINLNYLGTAFSRIWSVLNRIEKQIWKSCVFATTTEKGWVVQHVCCEVITRQNRTMMTDT